MPNPDFPQSLLAHALATISEGSLITDAAQNTLYANAAFTAITGYSQEEMLGRNCRILQGPGTDADTLDRLRRQLAAGEMFRGHLLNYRKHGAPFWNDMTVTALRNEGGEITHYLSVQRDVTTQVALQNQLRFQAQHDPLTGLPNRVALAQQLPKGFTHGGDIVAVGVIDLDDFGLVNERFGQPAGDGLLCELARRLQAGLNEIDLLARLGGDEFVVLIKGLDPHDPVAALGAALDRLHQAVATPFEVAPGQTVRMAMSMGLALFPLDRVEGDALLRRAITVLDQVKASKQDRACWWRLGSPPPMMQVPAAAGREATAQAGRYRAWRRRLFAGGLAMFMQPSVNLRTGMVHHVEALARLRLADGTVVLPAAFLPLLAEDELDRLFQIGLDQALAWINRWDHEGLGLDISVNLPPSTLLSPHCAAWVKTALSSRRIAPRRLSLELLETGQFEAGDRRQIAAIGQLIELGVKLVMDDLGSGYSSLKRLSLLPFDVVKIDYGLLAQLRRTPVPIISLMSSLIQIGRDFKQVVVVEGLEDTGMIEAAAILGAPFGQGNGLAPPIPAEELAKFVANFAAPTRPGRVTTWLGALAYHWQVMHVSAGHPAGLPDCPLTAFLAAQAVPHGQAAQWHLQIHTKAGSAESAGQMLTDWLVTQIQSETAAAGFSANSINPR